MVLRRDKLKEDSFRDLVVLKVDFETVDVEVSDLILSLKLLGEPGETTVGVIKLIVDPSKRVNLLILLIDEGDKERQVFVVVLFSINRERVVNYELIQVRGKSDPLFGIVTLSKVPEQVSKRIILHRY